jgi:group I intron endonuclease
MQGIYKIIYIKTGKCYVGSSVNIQNRWKNHLHRLKEGNHHSQGLQNIFNKYGINALKFEVIEEVQDKSKLIEREQYWINALNSYYKGFNGCRFVDCRVELSEKQKEKISILTKKAMEDPVIREKCRQSKIHGKSYTAKLTEQKVEEIKLQLQKPCNRRILAKKYNVSVDVIDDILSGLNWGYVRSDIIMYKNNIYKLTENDVIEIKKLLNEKKLTQLEIATKYNVIQQTISDIKLGKLWSKI